MFFFEFERKRFALFLQGGEGFFGVCAFGGETLRLFVAGGEVGTVLFERALGGAAVALDLLVLVVGLLVGVVRGAEGGFQGGHGWQGGQRGGGLFGFLLGLLLLAAGGGDVFGEGLGGALLLRAQLGAVRLLLGGEGEAVRELALLLCGLLVLALGGVVRIAGAGEGVGGGFQRGFEGLERTFVFGQFGFEVVDLLLSRQRVVATRRRLDAVLADEAAVEGEVLHAGGELVAGDVGVVRDQRLQRAEPGVEVGVARDVRLPGGGDAAARQLGALVGERGLPVFFAEGGVQACAEVAAEGGLPLWRDVQMVKQLRRGGEFGRLFGRRVLVFL